MSIPKVMGTETEYGISSPRVADFNPVMTSSLLIGTYSGSLRRIRWDYEEESPLRDARGFEEPSIREPVEDVGLANVILSNGARYYVDHAHPEYSTPECTNPLDLVVHDKAGERILERSLEEVERQIPDGPRINIYKNNSDGKGNSYGTHENYLVDRETPFADIVRGLTPFFVTRQIFTGAGKVGVEGTWSDPRLDTFQLSQRADFFEAEVGLETTLKRPIINTRDEPHADPAKYRRLHVIVGDANMSELATYLKLGATAIVLRMIEDAALPDLSLENPVAALHDVSRDITLRTAAPMRDGRSVTALDLQWEYLENANRWAKENDDTKETAAILSAWEETLGGLEADPLSLGDRLDWVAKYQLMTGFRERDGLPWNDHKLRLVDLQYHDVRRHKGLYHRLVAAGRMRTLVTEEEISRAVSEPPTDTRAFFRGRCIERFPGSISAASWDSIIFDTGGDALQRVPMREPLRGTSEHVSALLDEVSDAAALVAALRS
jgi:proteasome accessory factor A